MGKSAIMSVRITGNSDDAVKALSKVTAKASAFGTFMGGAALKGGNDIRGALIGPGVHASHGMERTHMQGVSAAYTLLTAYLIEK